MTLSDNHPSLMMRHPIFRFLLCSGIFLFSPEIFAAIFEVIPTDESRKYLGVIFGGNVGTVYLGPNPNPMLSMMMERFNFIIVTVGVIVLGWIAFISAVNTAREGEAMGKKMNAWIPIRSMLGMLLMVPTPGTGYSVIQITVMWIVLNGIGAANIIWGIVLDQMEKGVPAVGALNLGLDVSAIAPGTPPPMNAPSLIQAVTNAKVCQNVLNDLPRNSAWAQMASSNGWGRVDVHVVPQTFVDPALPPTSNPNPTSITATGSIVVGFRDPSGSGYIPVCGVFSVGSSLSRMPAIPGGISIPPRNSFNAATVIARRDIKLAALSAMFDAVDPAARDIASQTARFVGLGRYDNFPAWLANPPDIKIQPGYGIGGANAYLNTVSTMAGGVRVASSTGAGAGYTSSWQQDVNLQTMNTDLVNQLRSVGWIHAGSYYFALSGGGGEGLDDDAKNLPAYSRIPVQMQPVPTTAAGITGVDPCQVGIKPAREWEDRGLLLANGAVKEICILYYALANAYAYISTDTQNRQPQSIPIFGENPGSYKSDYLDDIINGIIGPLKKYIVEGFLGMTGPAGGEPLSSISSFGNGLMKIAEAIILGYIASSVLLAFGLSWSYCIASIGPGLHTLFFQFVFMITGLFILLWSTGAMLGLYLPMIPYIVFLTTAFGWMIAVAEALVGAPIIALALVHPGGEELGKSTTGLGILANIFLRPTMMIFGFVIAAALVRAALTFLNTGFASTVQVATNGLTSPFGFPAVLALYMGLVIAIVNKSFSLIHLLPDQILRWMGAPTEKSDTSQMIQEAQKGFEKGAAGSEALQKGIADSGQKKIMEDLDSKKKGGGGKGGGGGGGLPSGKGSGPGSPPGGGSAGGGGAGASSGAAAGAGAAAGTALAGPAGTAAGASAGGAAAGAGGAGAADGAGAGAGAGGGALPTPLEPPGGGTPPA